MKKQLHLLLASLAFAGLAHADDYASPEAFMPVSSNGNGHEEESVGTALSCKEARETAWFLRELSRTDGGNTASDVEYVPCPREVLAESTADYD